MRSLNDFYDLLPTFVGIWICFLKAIGIHWKTEKVNMPQYVESYFLCKKKLLYFQFRTLIQHVRHDWILLSKYNEIWIWVKYVERSRMFTLIYLSISNDKYIQRSLP